MLINLRSNRVESNQSPFRDVEIEKDNAPDHWDLFLNDQINLRTWGQRRLKVKHAKRVDLERQPLLGNLHTSFKNATSKTTNIATFGNSLPN